MNIKKIQAEDMNQAIRIISKEFGSDAMILEAKKVRKKGVINRFKKPHYEIVVEYDPAKTPLALKLSSIKTISDQKKTGPKHATNPAVGAEHPSAEQAGIQMVGQSPQFPAAEIPAGGKKQAPPKPESKLDLVEIKTWTDRLIANRVDPEIAYEVTKEAATLMSKKPQCTVREAFVQSIQNHILEAGTIIPEEGKGAVLFLGATGVGKTTSLAKIAADLSMNAKKKVGIINTDTYRIAAHEQLKIYSDILDIPVKAVYDGESVSEAIRELSDREIILIDTAGKRPGDPEHKALIEAIHSCCALEAVVLTISAPTSFEACREIIDSYGFIRDYKLLITKIDEISAYGNLLNLCYYSGKGLTYLTTGQNVPKDIEPADKEKIACLVLGERQADQRNT